jgi:hypothetical protein
MESRITFEFAAEVTLRELADDGPEAFAKRVRESLEAKLRPLLQIDWRQVSDRSTSSQNTLGQ